MVLFFYFKFFHTSDKFKWELRNVRDFIFEDSVEAKEWQGFHWSQSAFTMSLPVKNEGIRPSGKRGRGNGQSGSQAFGQLNRTTFRSSNDSNSGRITGSLLQTWHHHKQQNSLWIIPLRYNDSVLIIESMFSLKGSYPTKKRNRRKMDRI